MLCAHIIYFALEYFKWFDYGEITICTIQSIINSNKDKPGLGWDSPRIQVSIVP